MEHHSQFLSPMGELGTISLSCRVYTLSFFNLHNTVTILRVLKQTALVIVFCYLLYFYTFLNSLFRNLLPNEMFYNFTSLHGPTRTFQNMLHLWYITDIRSRLLKRLWRVPWSYTVGMYFFIFPKRKTIFNLISCHVFRKV